MQKGQGPLPRGRSRTEAVRQENQSEKALSDPPEGYGVAGDDPLLLRPALDWRDANAGTEVKVDHFNLCQNHALYGSKV